MISRSGNVYYAGILAGIIGEHKDRYVFNITLSPSYDLLLT